MKKFYYGLQTIENDDIINVSKSLKSNFITQGPLVQKFEKQLQNNFRSKYAVALSSGTAALHLAVKSLNLKENDCIITSPITFCATVNSILYNGYQVYLSDINRDDYTIDPNNLETTIKKLKKENKRIKAVIGVDYAGHPCDWKSLRYIANKYNLHLINDNCHSIGSKYFNNVGYAVKYADIVTQSYHPVKNFTTGEGGSVLTNNREFYKKIALLRSHGIKKNGVTHPWQYDIEYIGYNYRLTDFQCSLGISQLAKLKKFIKKRRLIANNYDLGFRNSEKITTPIVKKIFIIHIICIHYYMILKV